MIDPGIRQVVIDVLHKVTGKPYPEKIAWLRDPNNDMLIADLGIDSLDGIEWCMEIEALTGVELDPAELITVASLNALATLVANRQHPGKSESDGPQLVRAPRDAPLPLSFAQEAIWEHCRSRGDTAYTLAPVDRIVGPLDAGALRDCLSCIVQRQEILRTTFAEIDGRPAQIVHRAEEVALPIIELAPDADEHAEIRRAVNAERARVCDPSSGPLIRFTLLRISENEHLLIRACHHLLWDAGCGRLFLRELALLYQAKIEGKPCALAESEALQYADYAAWERKAYHPDEPAYRETINWWRKRFEGKFRHFELPFKRSAPIADIDPCQGRLAWPIDPDTARRLAELTLSETTTTFVVWLSGLAALLATEIGWPDVTVGSFMTNRRHPGVQNMIGYFANLMPLRCQPDLTSSFRNWMSEVRALVAQVQAHCAISHDELRNSLHDLNVMLPHIQVIFGAPMDGKRGELQFAGLKLTREELKTRRTMPWGFAMSLVETKGVQTCHASFDARTYDPDGVRRFMGRLSTLLDAASRSPNMPVDALLASSGSAPIPEEIGALYGNES